MSAGRELIPGGVTERVRDAGGESLRLALATALAGHPLDQALYALIGALGGAVLLAAETQSEAEELLQTAADDALNVVRLNWGQRAQLVAMGRRQ